MTISDNKQNLYYNKQLKPFADALKKSMTKAEVCLWKYCLKGGQLKGYKFRRQRPALKYIADFMCKELMLIIEVDGITHHYEEVFIKDMLKQRELEEYGFTVVRFKDEEILSNIQGVREFLEHKVDEITGNPPPAPSKGG